MTARSVQQSDLVDGLLAALPGQDHPLRQALEGPILTAVAAARVGLASRNRDDLAPCPCLPRPGDSTLALARQLGRPGSWLPPHLALAAVNALLPPPPGAVEAKGQDILLRLAQRQGPTTRVAVVGHFPFVDRLRQAGLAVDVLERFPRPGDLPAAAAATVLPRAQVVAISATSLVNGSLAHLLAMVAPQARVVVLGASTPFAAPLFDLGVDVLAGCAVLDDTAALAGVTAGLPFRRLAGVRFLAWARQSALLR